MKTAISIDDSLFTSVEKTAKILGIPRSKLFSNAVREYIKLKNHNDITERLNQVYGSVLNISRPNENFSYPFIIKYASYPYFSLSFDFTQKTPEMRA